MSTAFVAGGLCSSRGISVSFGLALLTGFVSVYLIDPSAYIFLIRLWMPLPLRTPFADTSYVIGQLECWRAGVDVYVSNPCDIFGRTQAYPPIWLRLWFLPAAQTGTVPLALLLATGFILSLAVLPRITRGRDIVLLLAAIGSPATGFAIERGNADLLIFILAALAILSADLTLPGRLVGYAGVLLAALLKLYPIALLTLLARERPRVAAILGIGATAVWAGVGWLWHDEFARAMANLPRPPYSYDGPGARKLAEGLITFSNCLDLAGGTLSCLIAGLFAFQVLAAAMGALLLARQAAFSSAFRALSSRESLCLAVGASMFCACFVAGVSIAYREILLLFTIPPLLRLNHHDALSPAVRWTPGMVVFLMWSTLPSRAIELTFGPFPAFAAPSIGFAFWLLCEVLWWWLFIVLAAALLCFLASAGGLQFVRSGTAGRRWFSARKANAPA